MACAAATLCQGVPRARRPRATLGVQLAHGSWAAFLIFSHALRTSCRLRPPVRRMRRRGCEEVTNSRRRRRMSCPIRSAKQMPSGEISPRIRRSWVTASVPIVYMPRWWQRTLMPRCDAAIEPAILAGRWHCGERRTTRAGRRRVRAMDGAQSRCGCGWVGPTPSATWRGWREGKGARAKRSDLHRTMVSTIISCHTWSSR